MVLGLATLFTPFPAFAIAEEARQIRDGDEVVQSPYISVIGEAAMPACCEITPSRPDPRMKTERGEIVRSQRVKLHRAVLTLCFSP